MKEPLKSEPTQKEKFLGELTAGKELRTVSAEEKNVHKRSKKRSLIPLVAEIEETVENRKGAYDKDGEERYNRHRRDRPKDKDDRHGDGHRRKHEKDRSHGHKERKNKHSDEERHKKRRDRHSDEEEHPRHKKVDKRREDDSDEEQRREERRERDERKDKKKRKDDERDRKHHRDERKDDKQRKISDEKSPPHGRKQERKNDAPKRVTKYQGIPPEGDANVPSWRANLMKRKEERERGDHYQPEEVASILDPGRQPTISPPKLESASNDYDDEETPAWRIAMKKRKEEQILLQAHEAELKKAQEEAKFAGVPEWKKKLMKQKDGEKQQKAAVMNAQMAERNSKLAEIAAMPEWRRKLFLEKNPEYKT